MTDWAVGDLALCVELNPRSPHGMGNLKVGGVYSVIGVVVQPYAVCVVLEDTQSEHETGAYQAFRFRKILPDKHEACEAEFITLLKRGKVKA